MLKHQGYLRADSFSSSQANNSNFYRSRGRPSLRDQPLAPSAWDQKEETEQSDSRADGNRSIAPMAKLRRWLG